MQVERFDLNDIQHEPSDKQLESLMDSVADAARIRAAQAKEKMLLRLRAEIVSAKSLTRQNERA
ncbi:MAG: hypothetical protein PHQ60_11690 [Sideroxydans sp.]|nr:hypothetical protein [Sideroxydans sp.]